jgi:hypothetical protein
MPNKDEKKRRRAIVREIKQKERAEAEAAMPISKPDLKALFEYVEVKFQEEGCNNTLSATRAFLSQRQLSEELIIDWLIDQGGGCDCEVMANVEETWGEYVGYS